MRLLLLFTLIPLADLILLIMLGKTIPFWATVLIIIGTGMVGAWLARGQWGKVKSRIQQRLQVNQVPSDLISDGMLILMAGGMLIAPGLITDALGISLLTPFCRKWYKKKGMQWLKEYFKVKVIHSFTPKDIVDGKVADPDMGSTPFSDGSQFEDMPILDVTAKPAKPENAK